MDLWWSEAIKSELYHGVNLYKLIHSASILMLFFLLLFLGIPCARGAPDVFDRVSSHRAWIIANAA